jgi:hypothetical protein
MNYSDKNNRIRTALMFPEVSGSSQISLQNITFLCFNIVFTYFPQKTEKEKTVGSIKCKGKKVLLTTMIDVVEIWSAVKFLTVSPNYSPSDTLFLSSVNIWWK